MSPLDPLSIEWMDLGLQPYESVWRAMQSYTQNRTDQDTDQIWLVEHESVFTQGQNGKAEHILNPGSIPVIAVDRGGQVTYHGPGQIVIYPLLNLKRRHLGVRELVTKLEQAMIALLRDYDINAYADPCAPGVYINGAKIGAIGLRVKKNCSYHGLAFNVDMDLSPYRRINPCGFSDLKVTQLRDLVPNCQIADVRRALCNKINDALSSSTSGDAQHACR